MRKKQLVLLGVLMVFTSIAEVVSIGAVIPFLGVLTAPEQVFTHPMLQPFIAYFQFTSADQLVLPLAILFGVAAIIAGASRLLLSWSSVRLAFLTGSDLSVDIYNKTLYQPYSVHISRNSSEVINAIATKSHAVVYQTLLPVLTIGSSLLILSAILLTLFSIAAEMALIALLGFGSIYGLIVFLTRKKLLENSKCVAQDSTLIIKSLQEGLGGIRDIIIDNSQQHYRKLFEQVERRARKAQGEIEFISSSPRFLMESLGMLLIAIIAYMQIVQSGDISSVIPMLGVLALSAQRLLPVLQQLYASVSHIQGSVVSLNETIGFLSQPMSDIHVGDTPALKFENSIILQDLSFKHNGQNENIVQDINLNINKGDKVGFIGKTGSGKSTVLDIVMGLLEPTNGHLAIDGTALTSDMIASWQKHIAHVPQTVFLSDSTIAENIAFGIKRDDINFEIVKRSAEQAQISAFIDSLPNGYQTIVGERGVKISGGQRQRLGIARALYKQADVIVFDEATSALDEKTERDVMKSIDSIGTDITVLIIAHRISTLKNCNKIVRIADRSLELVSDID